MTPSQVTLTVIPVAMTAGMGSRPAQPMSVPVITLMMPILMVIARCGSITLSCVRTVISMPCLCA